MEESPARDRVGRVALGIAIALTALPFVVLAVQVLANPRTAPLGDQALIELRVHDVGGAHTPLVGSYQKFGWNQPGPALLYLLTVPYRLLGTDYAALQAGAVLLNALAIAGVVWIALRRGGPVVALWTMALLGLLVSGRGPDLLADPWEPSLSILALVLLVLVVTELALGRAWAMPVAAGLATVIAQAWATTAVMAAVLLGWGVVAFAARWRRYLQADTAADAAPDGGAAWHRPTVVSALVLLVLWVPPVVQQLRGDPGNVTLMWRFFTAAHSAFGLVPAYRAVSIELGLKAPWMGFAVPLRPFVPVIDETAGALVPVALLALLAGGALAARRRDPSVALAASVLVMVVAGVVALSRLVGDPFVEVLDPTAAYGFACWLAAGWCLISAGRGARRVRLATILVPALTAVVAVFSVLNTVAAADAPKRPSNDERAVRVLADRAVPVARRAGGPVLVRSDVSSDRLLLGEIGPQLLALTLARAGVDVRVAAGDGHKYGGFRAHPADARMEMVLSYAADAPQGDGWERVATVDPLSPRDRAARNRLERRIDAAFGPITGRAARLVELQHRPRLRALVEARDRIKGTEPLAVSARRLGG